MAARSRSLELEPDLTTLGKIVGGGLPVGAYGGRAEIMDHVLPAGKVFQAGTLSGNPLATAAGCAMLESLKEQPPYERLEQLSARLEAGLRARRGTAGVPHTIHRVGSMLTLFFHPGPIRVGARRVRATPQSLPATSGASWTAACTCRAASIEALFVSAAHTEADIDATIARQPPRRSQRECV